MSVEIKIPAVGESINSGTVAQWHKKDGEYVKIGDVVLTLETDKISTEIESPASGILKTAVAEGEEVPIGAVVAMVEEGEAPSGGGEEASSVAPDAPAHAPAVKPQKAEPEPEAETEAEPAKPAVPAPAPVPSVPVSPTVKAFAEEKSVDLGLVTGTGKKGAITKADVKAFLAAPPAPEPATTPAPAEKPDLAVVPKADSPASQEEEKSSPAAEADESRFTRKKMSQLRRKIATHLVNAQQSAAILTTFNECDMTAVMKLRKSVQENFVEKHGVKLGFMSFFIKAVVDALKVCPQVNARVDGNDMILNHFFDVGVAVGTEKGLFVPVIRDCDSKSFAEIEKDIIGYANRAKEGKIQLSDLQGGVFTISNGGVYGSLLSIPILNPPQSGILGMHTIQQRPVAVDGKVEIRPMMYLALSYDHRIVDGKEAVTFLIRVKECIENPTRLLVGA